MPWRLACVLLLCGILFASEPTAIWIDVPFARQTRDGCGAASLAMVMRYWAAHGHVVTPGSDDPDAILNALYSRQGHGIYASKLEAYLKRNGFRTFAIKGTWADLNEQLQKGRPLVVALRPGSSSLHYVVVVGIDPTQELVMVNDPAERKLLKRERAVFEKEWSATQNWTLLAIPDPGAQ